MARRMELTSSAQTGGVDEDAFVRVFEDVPHVQLFSVREMEDQLSSIRDTIYDPKKDWSKRVDALKKLRSLVIAGAAKYEEFHTHLKLLEQPFQSAVRDLRSQVVREACVTIAYLSQELRNKLDHFSEVILSSLINLIPNSAKIMASSGSVTICFILRNTHHARLIPIITSNCSSKSKAIRRACCAFIELILQCWSTHLLKRQLPSLQEAIRKGIADADPDARTYSRKAFWNFKSHFPDNANQLLNSLDSTYRKALNCDLGMSNSSSTNSLNQHTSVNNRLPSANASGKSHLHSAPDVSNRLGSSSRALTKFRSNSAIDLQAAQRTKARAQYAALARHKVGSGASLPRPVRKAPSSVPSTVTSLERLGRTRNRPSNISQSQPTSRSGSPSSSLSYATCVARDIDGCCRPTGIPVSTGTSCDASRETCPNQFLAGPSGSKLGSFRNRPAHLVNEPEHQTHARPVMAQKTLQQSGEAETALADALTSDNIDSGEVNRRSMIGRKSYRSFEEHSDDTETSKDLWGVVVEIATYMEQSAFNPGIDEAVSAIAKVMTWYQTAKNPEVKKAAQNAIISLFNLNTPQVTMILSKLPPEYQEAAATVVHSHLRRNSTSPSSHLQSLGTPQSLNQASIDTFDDPLNPDVYRSLHRTTAEIQNYSFDGSLSTVKPLDKERETTSQDSGISQLLGERIETLEERINRLFVFSNDFLSDIIKKKEQGSQLHKTETTCNKDSDVPSQGAAYNEEREVLFTVFEALQLEKGELKTSVQDCKKALTNVRHLIKNGFVSAVIDMFKDLLKCLLYILATNENRLKSITLGVLTEMFSNRKVCAHFGNFVELVVLRVLSSYSDPNKEISRAAEQCALAIGANLSATHLIGVLCPLINTREFPINLAAVKILTKVMESNAREVIEPNIDHIMAVLLQAYDQPEISVRKSAVFCMVALHSVVGEEILKPFLANMSASKLKLLNLYIQIVPP